MNGIKSVYIIKREGKALFIHQKHIQGSEEIEEMLFSKFITAFQIFMSELGTGETSTIMLGISSIFTIRERENLVYYILKCELDADSDSMYEILREIQSIFRKDYIEKGLMNKEVSSIEMNKLRNQILECIKPKSNMEKFMEALS